MTYNVSSGTLSLYTTTATWVKMGKIRILTQNDTISAMSFCFVHRFPDWDTGKPP